AVYEPPDTADKQSAARGPLSAPSRASSSCRQPSPKLAARKPPPDNEMPIDAERVIRSPPRWRRQTELLHQASHWHRCDVAPRRLVRAPANTHSRALPFVHWPLDNSKAPRPQRQWLGHVTLNRASSSWVREVARRW